ncbi:MAG TPA: hypothetical protein VM536_15280 [Chloroflexia bacterium]|nr:hypothetical protein [Chloroflexia bacterium]
MRSWIRGGLLLAAWVLLLVVSAACDADNLNPFAPAPTATATATATPTWTPTPTNTPSPTNTATPSNTPTNTPTLTPTYTPRPTNTPLPTPTPLIAADECQYLKWLGTALLKLAVNGAALNRDAAALSRTSIFNPTWYHQTLADLAAERDAAAPVRAGYSGPVPSRLADMDRQARDYAGRVYSASASGYTGLSQYDLLAFNQSYQAFGPLSADGDQLSRDLDAWAQSRSYSTFAAAATTCR